MYDEQVKLYIQCPNIEASMYAQNKLREVFGFEILGNKEPHFTDRFVVVNPPTQCYYALCKKSYFEMKRHQEKCTECHKYENDKPLILSYETTMNQDGEFSKEGKDKNWIPMFDALQLIASVNEKLSPNHDI